MYKILIVKNRFKKKYNFKKGIDWFSKYTPLKVEISEMETDFDLIFKSVKNDTYEGVMAVPHEQLRTVVPRNTYNAVVLLYGNDAGGIRVSACDNVPLYPETDMLQVAKYDDGGKVFNHELIHAFFQKLRRLGIYIEDPMDKVFIDGQWMPYFNNNDLTAEYSNRTIALDRLKPFWDKVEYMGIAPVTPTPAPMNYTANFDRAFDHLMKWEGGFVDNPNDPGGATKYGISSAAYPTLNISALKLEDAKAIYFRDYWTPNKCDQMRYSVALNVFDMGVNCGVKTSAMTLQEALTVGQDGKIGPITLAAVAKKSPADLIEVFSTLRIMRYSKDKNFNVFGKGWVNRTLDTVTTSLSTV